MITNDWFAHFRLLQYKPGLIIYLTPDEFNKINLEGDLRFQLSINGEIKKFDSANVIAQIGKSSPSAKEILITAHLDTYRTNNPGASDNASGISVVLELAKYFKQIEDELSCVIKFIAFGGEEVGILGSRHYLYSNFESLQNCELLFNLDDVGGHNRIVVEKEGGVQGLSTAKGLSQIPELIKTSPWEGVNSYWRILPQEDELLKIFGASNHPGWLVKAVEESIDRLGYDVVYTGTQGSDQLAFAQAGIVTSGIGIIGDHAHTPEDKPEHINRDSLKKAGEITAHVVINTMKRMKEKKPTE